MWPLMITNTTPIPDKYHKKSCILLPVNLFQLIYELTNIDVPLVDHQYNPHICSVSQTKLYSTAQKYIPYAF